MLLQTAMVKSGQCVPHRWSFQLMSTEVITADRSEAHDVNMITVDQKLRWSRYDHVVIMGSRSSNGLSPELQTALRVIPADVSQGGHNGPPVNPFQ